MTDTKTLTNYAKDPELAVENLAELLACVESQEESVQLMASEALENCGPPNPKQIAFLCAQLKSTEKDKLYWSCTLLGRLGQSLLDSAHKPSVMENLLALLEDESLDLAARERAAWAMGEIGSVEAEAQLRLRQIAASAPPRLKRLIEAAMTR
jgi:hypothetical protein